MSPPRTVRLFKNGVNQAVRIPRDLELPGDEAPIYRDGMRLVLEATARGDRIRRRLSVRHLLDTPVLSQLVRDSRGAVAERLSRQVEFDVFTSIVVACELRHDTRKEKSPLLKHRINQRLASIEVAAQEFAEQATLVTDNTAEFGRVPGLIVENWLQPD